MAYGKRGVNWGMVITAIILAAIVVFFGFATEGFKNWDPKTWFQEEIKAPSEGSGVFDEEGNDLSDGQVHPMGKKMIFRAAASEVTTLPTMATIKATFEPADVGSLPVDWDLMWKNPASTWATGKDVSAYVRLTMDGDGVSTVQIECQQPFGESVVLKVSVREKPEITASCAVEYAKRLSSFVINSNDVNLNHENFTFDFSNTSGTQNINHTYTYTPGVGTISDTYTSVFTVSMSAGFNSWCLDEGLPMPDYIAPVVITNGYDTGVKMFEKLFGAEMYSNSANFNSLISQIKRYGQGGLNVDILTFTCVATGKYSTQTKTFGIKDIRGLNLRVTGINIDNEIIF